MARCLLFCISEEAKALVHDALNTGGRNGNAEAGEEPKMYYLVESREGPLEGQRFKSQLQADETFDTDFIGATPVDCQRWADERCRHDRAPHEGLITIFDAQSVKDGTLLMQRYVEPPEGTEEFVFGEYGVLPRETNVWYDFRVNRRHAGKVIAALMFTSPEVTYPIWFENKEKFTDENGVFDVQEADRYCMGADPDVIESEIHQRRFRPAPRGV